MKKDKELTENRLQGGVQTAVALVNKGIQGLLRPTGLRYTIYVLVAIGLVMQFMIPLFGKALHKTIGPIVIGILIIHNLYNFRWYTSLHKGRYSPVRWGRLLVNLGLLLSFLGVIAIYVKGLSLGLDKRMIRYWHGLGGYWMLFFWAIHLGMHGSVIMGYLKRLGKFFSLRYVQWLGISFWVFMSLVGIYSFVEIPWPAVLSGTSKQGFVMASFYMPYGLFLQLGFIALWSSVGYLILGRK